MKRRYRVKAAYLFLWMLIFIIPVAFVVFGNSGNIGDFRGMAHTFMFVWSLVVVFFFNYTFLIDQYLYSQRSKYVIFNIVLVGLLALIMFAWEKMDFDIMNGFVAPDMNVPRRGYMFHPRMGGGGFDIFRPVHPFRHNLPLFIMGKILPLMLMIGMAIAIKAIYRLNKAEREVKELERSRTEAELKNLRNQLNPHFLFNTLNNIYALIDISPDKARLSILQLSDMMRHVLYNDKSRYNTTFERVAVYRRLRVPYEIADERQFGDNSRFTQGLRRRYGGAADVHIAGGECVQAWRKHCQTVVFDNRYKTQRARNNL